MTAHNPQRMSDKQLAEYDWLGDTGTKPEIVGNRFHLDYTLWQALIAERAVVERVEVEAQSWRDLEPVAGTYYANRVQAAIHPQEPSDGE